jgi:hypothetical protein
MKKARVLAKACKRTCGQQPATAAHGLPRLRVNRSFIGVALWLAIAVVSSAPAEAQFAGSAWGRNAESQLDDWTGVDRHTPVPMRDL